MSDEIRKKLAGELLRYAAWEDVRPHIIRDVVFVVRGVPLIDVGTALATDNRAAVQALLESGQLAKPIPEDLQRWVESKTQFAALIVSPFVLIQEEVENMN